MDSGRQQLGSDVPGYFGAGTGLSFIFADNQVGGSNDEAPACNEFECLDAHLRATDDHGSLSLAATAVVGYEYRLKRNLAVNVEAFMGVTTGEDEDNQEMTNGTYGLAVGLGI